MPFNLSGTGFQPVVFTLTDGQDARPTFHQTQPSPFDEIGMEAADILEVSGRYYVTTLDELGQSPRIRRSGPRESPVGRFVRAGPTWPTPVRTIAQSNLRSRPYVDVLGQWVNLRHLPFSLPSLIRAL